MKALSNLTLLPALLFFQIGQYRGPDYEALFGTSSVNAPDDTTPGGTVVESAALEGFNRWEFWFEINKDILLRSRRAQRQWVLGPKAVNAVLGANRIDSEAIEKQILPALKEALRSPNPEISQSAALALGKIAFGSSTKDFQRFLDSNEAESRRIGLLTLGLVEERQALAKLLDVLNSNSAPDIRAYAVLGVGVRASAETVSILKDFVEKHLDAVSAGGEFRDLMIASVAALGMSRDASVVTLLVQKYKALSTQSQARSKAVRSTILTALGRIGDTSAFPVVMEALREGDHEIQRAAALACGDFEDPGAVEALATALKESSDIQTRCFAAVSLGRIGGAKAREALRESFASKKSNSVKAYSAIGLGLAGDEGSGENLRKLAQSTEDDSLRSAACMGLGFLRDQASIPVFLEMIEKASTPARLRGYASIALGLIRPDGALPKMLEALRKDASKNEEFLRGILLGIGLFRDPAASSELMKVLSEDKRESVCGYAALALGMIRDKGVVSALLDLTSGKTKSGPHAAASACIALGAIGDRHQYPLISEAFFNSNYRIQMDVLSKVQRYF